MKMKLEWLTNLLDKILYSFTEKNQISKKIANELSIDVDEVEMIIKKVQTNEHKTKLPESPKKTIL